VRPRGVDGVGEIREEEEEEKEEEELMRTL
jgi:hypothetical protein